MKKNNNDQSKSKSTKSKPPEDRYPTEAQQYQHPQPKVIKDLFSQQGDLNPSKGMTNMGIYYENRKVGHTQLWQLNVDILKFKD